MGGDDDNDIDNYDVSGYDFDWYADSAAANNVDDFDDDKVRIGMVVVVKL